jgi:chromate transporter
MLGSTSFGGPVAHLAFLRSEFVERRRWLDDDQYSDLVALCQFLPGPASSQVVFALGMQRAGVLGALLASACFLLPSAVLMTALGYGVTHASVLGNLDWFHGLKVAAVAVVAQAVWSMGRRLCPDLLRVTLCIASSATLLWMPSVAAQLLVIIFGGFVGVLAFGAEPQLSGMEVPPVQPNGRHGGAIGALGTFGVLLVALPGVSSLTDSRVMAAVDAFYRAGSLVFGGGHVVLPLLRAELVPSGFLTDDQFLAGYGAAQAIPGPLFALSAYLGATMELGLARWVGALLALFSIFLPALLLIGGALPFWQTLRQNRRVQAALMGANASVVGILLGALYDPVAREGIRGPLDLGLALLGFALLQVWKAPSWLVVIGTAILSRAALFFTG